MDKNKYWCNVYFESKKSQAVREQIFREDIGHSLDLEMKRCGMELEITNLRENGAPQHLRWCRNSKRQVSWFSRAPVPWVVEFREGWKAKDSIHFTADGSNRDLLSKMFFSAISSVSTVQFRIGAINSVHEEGEESEIATAQEAVNTEILMSVDAEEVNSLVSSLRTALETDQAKILRASSVYRKKVNSQCCCNLASFWKRVTAGDYFITKPSTEDVWSGFTPQCRDYTRPRGHLHTRIFAAILGGTKNGPSFEVQVEQILGTHGLEGAVPSKRDFLTTFWVLTSRSKNRLVNEVRVPNVSHNVSSTELFSEQASSKETEPCEVTDTRSRKLETNPTRVGKPAANPGTLTERPVCFTKGTIPALERKWRIFLACPTYAGRTLSTGILKMVKKKLVRHFLIKMNGQLMQLYIGIRWDQCYWRRSQTRERTNFRNKNGYPAFPSRKCQGLVRVFWIFSKSLAYLRAIQGNTGGMAIAPELMGPTNHLLHANPFGKTNNKKQFMGPRRRVLGKMIQRTGSRMTIWHTQKEERTLER